VALYCGNCVGIVAAAVWPLIQKVFYSVIVVLLNFVLFEKLEKFDPFLKIKLAKVNSIYPGALRGFSFCFVVVVLLVLEHQPLRRSPIESKY
jgi:hypothetical protein